MTTAKEIGFGIEIECNIPNVYSDSFPVGRYHRGIQSPVLPQGWNTQSDCSIQSEYGTFGAEIVSPVLKGEDGLTQVIQVLDLLDQIGARTNRSCGLHVHVGIEHLNHNQITRMIKLFKKYERAFYALNGDQASSRFNSTFCKPSSMWKHSDGHADNHEDRYQSLNLENINRGHIEIRVWSGNLKPEIVLSAIYMAVALVSRSADETLVKTSDVDKFNHVQTMEQFLDRFVIGKHMIIDDLDPNDLIEECVEQAEQSTF